MIIVGFIFLMRSTTGQTFFLLLIDHIKSNITMDPFGHLLKLLKSSISPQEGTVVSPYSTEPRGTIRINKDDVLNKQFSLFLVFFLAFFFCFSFFRRDTKSVFFLSIRKWAARKPSQKTDIRNAKIKIWAWSIYISNTSIQSWKLWNSSINSEAVLILPWENLVWKFSPSHIT